MATVTEGPMQTLSADQATMDAIIYAVNSCLTMCGTTAKCVGLSTIPTPDPGRITGMIGVHGDVSGFITINMSEKVALATVGGLLQEEVDVLSPQVIDGVGEMTNLISGGIKKGLLRTPWGFSHVTVPSVIIGHNYQIAYSAGLHYLCVVFEHDCKDSLMLEDRLMQVAISLIRL